MWNLIGYLYFQLVSLVPFIRDNYAGNIESFSILGMLQQCVVGDYNLVTWFLRVLIVYTFINPLIYPLSKNKTVSRIILVASFALCIFTDNDYFVHYCFYYLGVYFALYEKELFLKKNDYKLISLMLLIAITIIYLNCNIAYYGVFGRIIYSVMSILLWYSLDFLRIEKKPLWWCSYTILFYCCHELVLEPIERLFLIIFGNNILGAILDFMLAPIITLLLMVVFLFIIRKVPFIFNLLTGFRKEK